MIQVLDWGCDPRSAKPPPCLTVGERFLARLC